MKKDSRIRFFFLLLSTVPYITGFIWGLVSPLYVGEEKDTALSGDSTSYDAFFYIAENNLKVILSNIVGFLSCGIYSVIQTFINGFSHGFSFQVLSQHYSISSLILYTLPHILEIVAIIWSCYISYSLSYKLIMIFFVNKKCFVKTKSLVVQMIVCVLSVVVSAYFESYVSIHII